MKTPYKLYRRIIELSTTQDWDKAKMEWELVEVLHSDTPQTCLCGHSPILELCIIRNFVNQNRATVGNCCVRKFVDKARKALDAFGRIATDANKALNPEAIQYAYERGWMSEWERDFYLNTHRKRKLTFKQASKRWQINIAVLMNLPPRHQGNVGR